MMKKLWARMRRFWHCLFGMMSGHQMVTHRQGRKVYNGCLCGEWFCTVIGCSCGKIFWARSKEDADQFTWFIGLIAGNTKHNKEARLPAEDSKRMIFDVSPEVQMAIRLRAVKNGINTGDVVRQAMEAAFPEDIEEARHTLRLIEGYKAQKET